MPHDIRDNVIDYISDWSEKTEIPAKQFIYWVGIAKSKYYDWIERYGKANENNGKIPKDFWLTDEEKIKIIDFYRDNPLNGYRRLTFMMQDANVVFVSPSTTKNVLKRAGLMGKSTTKPSKKGTGFVQPLAAHQHWHVDISYINLCGTFYYLCSILDGFSRYIVHWEIRESMKESEVETIIQRGLEKYPEARPRIISDNGPQFIARDFKSFIKLSGMDHVRTSPFYPQSNGKIERWHKELKRECIRSKQASTIGDVIANVTEFVDHYNNVRLHSAIGYIAPRDMLLGNAESIHRARDEKLAKAREERKQARKRAAAEDAEKTIGLRREPLAGDEGAVKGSSAGRPAAAPLAGPESQPECDRANGLKESGGKVSELH